MKVRQEAVQGLHARCDSTQLRVAGRLGPSVLSRALPLWTVDLIDLTDRLEPARFAQLS